jgi:hypothetical protein
VRRTDDLADLTPWFRFPFDACAHVCALVVETPIKTIELDPHRYELTALLRQLEGSASCSSVALEGSRVVLVGCEARADLAADTRVRSLG